MKEKHFVYIILSCLAVLALLSCSPSKKAHKYFEKHPEEFASDCAGAFPCLDSTANRIDTVAHTVIVDHSKEIDSISNSFDSLRNAKYEDSVTAAISHDKCREVVNARAGEIARLNNLISNLRANYKPCVSTIVTITKDHYITPTAKIKALEQERDKAVLQAVKYKDKYNWWLIACLITWGIAGIYIAYKIFKPKI